MSHDMLVVHPSVPGPITEVTVELRDWRLYASGLAISRTRSINSCAIGKAVPGAVRDRLEQACAKAFASAAFQRVAKNTGVNPIYLPGPEFAKRLAEDSREKAELIKALNITVD
jgi:tripartite-type tricarboxylate transporter receptor subunit TctC